MGFDVLLVCVEMVSSVFYVGVVDFEVCYGVIFWLFWWVLEVFLFFEINEVDVVCKWGEVFIIVICWIRWFLGL